MRIDRVLHWLCLHKSRSRAARECQAGRVRLHGAPVRPAQEVRPGDEITVIHPLGAVLRRLSLRRIPRRQISRREAGDYYEVIAERRLQADEAAEFSGGGQTSG